MNWQALNGHNGYVDLLLDLGVVGFATFMLSFGMSFVRAIAWLRLHSGTEGLYPLACLTCILLYNVTESTLVLAATSFSGYSTLWSVHQF
ncbi:hypothetical protein [Myxacorys almedinensis]|uniref:Uncharacterized protein n=1 Tax=Myxacorys almedinensis A TaxID=2690445 RepID=A0A8J7Z3V9_9CYAN|nr:hypothetical protein [Myxacorys almedinensis]NDJ18835.1 hypothetical protein [Myxacorys almedinensis A]